MIKVAWLPLLTAGLLCSAGCFADDVHFSKTDTRRVSDATLSVAAMVAESEYRSRWRLSYSSEATAYLDDLRQPIADFDFRDAGALARLSMLRGLSLLTLVETRRTRLFVGVNEDGLVGLHFGAFSRYEGERYMELARMPYLKNSSREEE